MQTKLYFLCPTLRATLTISACDGNRGKTGAKVQQSCRGCKNWKEWQGKDIPVAEVENRVPANEEKIAGSLGRRTPRHEDFLVAPWNNPNKSK